MLEVTLRVREGQGYEGVGTGSPFGKMKEL